MPIDYSRFNNLGDSDSDDGETKAHEQSEVSRKEDAELLAELPPDLPQELSLVLAARHGQTNVVEALLNASVSPNAVDPNGASALLRSIEGGTANRSCIELLLKRNAAVDLRSEAGDMPLSYAAEVGSKELLETLLSAGAPSKDVRGVALAAASNAGNAVIARMMLNSGANVDAVDKEGRTALQAWARRGEASLASELLSLRASVNIQDKAGVTPLLAAIRAGSLPLVEQLCAHGADTSLQNKDGRTALVMASELPDKLFARDLCGALLEAKAQVDAADGVGRRPLVCAAAGGNKTLCDLLLEHSAPVDARGTSGKDGSGGVTALSIATSTGDLPLVETLLRARASLELVDERGCPPVMTSARLGHIDVCRLLLSARALADQEQEGSGKTSLLLAAGAGHKAVCEALLSAGADSNRVSPASVAPLHSAAANGHEEVCQLLLASGANAQLPGPQGQDAATLASNAGHLELAEKLRIGS